MKNNYILIIMIGVLLFFFTYTVLSNKTVTTMYQNKKTVILDAGHGGADPGKVAGGIYEKDINLEITKQVKIELEALGYNVIMTREDDEMPKNKQDEMYKRKTIANSSDGDIFVSIHQNSSGNSSAKGFQVYYFHKSEESKRLADTVYSKIKEEVNPSTKFTPIGNNNYYVLRQTSMPAVLIECGFLTNSGERWLLTTKDYQKKMAKGIANGVDSYFKLN